MFISSFIYSSFSQSRIGRYTHLVEGYLDLVEGYFMSMRPYQHWLVSGWPHREISSTEVIRTVIAFSCGYIRGSYSILLPHFPEMNVNSPHGWLATSTRRLVQWQRELRQPCLSRAIVHQSILYAEQPACCLYVCRSGRTNGKCAGSVIKHKLLNTLQRYYNKAVSLILPFNTWGHLCSWPKYDHGKYITSFMWDGPGERTLYQ
jgi:hypothetical protein